jgi:hypothetical protein
MNTNGDRARGPTMVLVLVLLAVAVGPAAAPAAAEPAPAGAAFIEPLVSEGFLWAPPPAPLGADRLRFSLGFNHHAYDYRVRVLGVTYREELTLSWVQFLLAGELRVWDELTAGADFNFLMVHDISSENDSVDDSGADLGHLRLHLRYPIHIRSAGLVITPMLRGWLPTNTFLEVDVGSGQDRASIDRIESLGALEPMLAVAWAMRWLSVSLTTGPRFYLVDDADDFALWGIDLALGSAPVPDLEALQLMLELNMLIEIDDDVWHAGDVDDTAVPLALSLGARYRLRALELELGFRIGLHDAELYYGDFQLGLSAGYRF